MNSVTKVILLISLFNLFVKENVGQTNALIEKDSVEFLKLSEAFRKVANNRITEDEAEFFFEKVSKKDNEILKARAAAVISELFFQQRNNKSGEAWYQKAVNLFYHNSNYLESGICNLNIGRFLTRHYDFETGLPYLLKSIQDFSKTNDYNRLAKAYNILSLSYHDFGKYDKGLESAQDAFDVLTRNIESIDENLFWYVYNNMGINYDDSNQPYLAIEAHLQALPYAINASDSSYSYNNLGNTFKKLKKFKEAEKYFELALQNSTDYEDQYHLATIFSNLVDIERLQKNYDKAHTYLDSAIYYAKRSGSPEKLLDIFYYIFQLKKETGNYQEATQYLYEHVKLKDSFFSNEKNKAVLQFQTKYETEKKEKALMQTQFDLTRSELASRQKNYWLLLAFSSLIMAGLLFISLRSKSKMKEKRLALENKLLQEKADFVLQQQRLEISRNLHDNMGAQLTLISATVDSLTDGNNNMSDEVRSKLVVLSHLCETSISELRNTIWVLNKNEILIGDLRMKMINFINQAAEAQEKMNFHFFFEVIRNEHIDAGKAINILRLIQELVNNAIKHSEAKDVFISIKQGPKSLIISCKDNGKGFDQEAIQYTSYGLTNMQNRVSESGGKMHLISDETGTIYNIEIIL